MLLGFHLQVGSPLCNRWRTYPGPGPWQGWQFLWAALVNIWKGFLKDFVWKCMPLMLTLMNSLDRLRPLRRPCTRARLSPGWTYCNFATPSSWPLDQDVIWPWEWSAIFWLFPIYRELLNTASRNRPGKDSEVRRAGGVQWMFWIYEPDEHPVCLVPCQLGPVGCGSHLQAESEVAATASGPQRSQCSIYWKCKMDLRPGRWGTRYKNGTLAPKKGAPNLGS